jgi:hypothetical protein
MAEDNDFMSEAYAREQREANAADAENSLGRAWQEHASGEPGHAFLSPDEQDAAANRFFERESAAGRLSPTMLVPNEESIIDHGSRDEAIAVLKSLSHGPEKRPLPNISKNIER